MRISVSEAKGQLTELVRRAEAGEEVVLTRHGQAAARLLAVRAPTTAAERFALIDRLRRSAAAKASPGPGAARDHDDLYGADGLPR